MLLCWHSTWPEWGVQLNSCDEIEEWVQLENQGEPLCHCADQEGSARESVRYTHNNYYILEFVHT